MAEHVHNQKFDGDDPYLTCSCGKVWDALTGIELKNTANSGVSSIEDLIKIYGKLPTDANLRRIMSLIEREKIAHADKVIGTNIKSAIGNFNEKDAKAHAAVQEFCDFVNYHKGLMRKRNK